MRLNNYFKIGFVLVTAFSLQAPASSGEYTDAQKNARLRQNQEIGRLDGLRKAAEESQEAKEKFARENPPYLDYNKLTEAERKAVGDLNSEYHEIETRRRKSEKAHADFMKANPHILSFEEQQQVDRRAREGRKAAEERLNTFPPISPVFRKPTPSSQVYSSTVIEGFRLAIEAHPTPNGIDFFRVTSSPIQLIVDLLKDEQIRNYINNNGIEVPITLINGLNDPVGFEYQVKRDLKNKDHWTDFIIDGGETRRFESFETFEEEVLSNISMTAFFQLNLQDHLQGKLTDWLFDILIETDSVNEQKYASLRDEFFHEHISRQVREMKFRLQEYTQPSGLKPDVIQRVLDNGLDSSMKDSTRDYFLTHKYVNVEQRYLRDIQDTFANLTNPMGRQEFLVFEYSRIDGRYILLRDSDKRDQLMKKIRNGQTSYVPTGCEQIIGGNRIDDIINRDPTFPYE